MGEAKIKRKRIRRGAVQLSGWQTQSYTVSNGEVHWRLLKDGRVMYAPFLDEEKAWRFAEFIHYRELGEGEAWEKPRAVT